MKSFNEPTEHEFSAAALFFNEKLAKGCVFALNAGDRRLDAGHQSSCVITQKEDTTLCQRVFMLDKIEVKLEAVLYSDLPVMEWTVYVRNTADTVSLAVSFNALDSLFAAQNVTLYRNTGSDNKPEDFMPHTEPLLTGNSRTIAPFEGRSSNHEWPYFALALGNYGINIAIGWLAQWSACFDARRDGLHIQCGQQDINAVMLPGEQFRSPRIVLQFWDYRALGEGSAVRRSKNIFRRYMRRHNMPRGIDGKAPLHELSACSSHQFLEMTRANTENQKQFISGYCEKGIKLDNWWMDAGWYPCRGDWQNLGKWDYDPERFPNGLREISDYAATKDMGVILWHEIERVRMGEELQLTHPEFLLYGDDNRQPEYGRDTRDMLFNFANPQALSWITNKISDNITKYGVSIYRQDFNSDLLPFLQNNENPDRRGALENHYVTGMLTYWDTLLAEHPGLFIDMCASGGRRNDIDVMKRALVFIRSDYLFEPTSEQCHMAWLSDWLPFSGTGLILGSSVIDDKAQKVSFDRYALESCFTAHMTCCFDVRDDALDWVAIRKLLEQWRDMVDCYGGDYYPLTPAPTLENDIWLAWQFNRTEEGDGVVQAFRRTDNKECLRTFALHDLDPDAVYQFIKYDTDERFELTGCAAMETGITISLQPRTSAAIKYSKK